MTVLVLHNSVMPYAWGGIDELAAWTGVSNPDRRPQAELWLGAHPKAPSRIGRPDGPTLDSWLLAHPAELGAATELPFLMKVLAAQQPLSIQCHPNRAQAEAGFAREDAAGVPRDAPQRSYRDPGAKPEMVVALTPFHLLEGFRPLQAVHALLREAAIEEPAPSDLPAVLDSLLDGERSRRLLHAVLSSPHPEFDVVRRLRDHHPDDPACLAGLWLNTVVLQPGEALFLGAQRLHAYLEGVAVEVMGNSDNVLRGGLTHKHVDRDALRATVDLSATPPHRVRPKSGPEPAWTRYDPPTPSFALERGEADRELTGPRHPGRPELLFSTGGEVELRTPEEVIRFEAPQGAFVGAGVSHYRVTSTRPLFRCAQPAPEAGVSTP
jgi:mannose-6-phosphate isomerase